MAIKKAYQSIVTLLEANRDAQVSDVIDEVIALSSAKKAGGGGVAQNVRRDEDGNVTHVFCYYHKKWEDVTVAEYGKKANSATGLNNMCKEGVSAWTKQQRAAKSANEELLARVASGELSVEDIPAEQEAIQEARSAIVPREDGHGDD